MPIPVDADAVDSQTGTAYPEPFRSRMGVYAWKSLGDAFGLDQFGCNLETFEPGAQSSVRHWHSSVDEIVYMLEGELTLVVDEGEFTMTPGMVVGFPAGDTNAHHLVNRSDEPARALIIGTRNQDDKAFYPHDDLAWLPLPDGFQACHKDGTPYPDGKWPPEERSD